MTFNEILKEIIKRMRELAKMESELCKKYSDVEERYIPGYNSLLDEINKNKGNFFFIIQDFHKKPIIKLMAKENKILNQLRISIPLDKFVNTEEYENDLINWFKQENKKLKKRKIEETKSKMKEYARYLHLRKKFENE